MRLRKSSNIGAKGRDPLSSAFIGFENWLPRRASGQEAFTGSRETGIGCVSWEEDSFSRKETSRFDLQLSLYHVFLIHRFPKSASHLPYELEC